ncbi:MAG: carbon storage regulator [Phycisphaeraceae bacterium]
MLIVERKLNSSIRIGSDIRIRVVEVPGRRRVRLGLEVPAHTRIWREDRGTPDKLTPATDLKRTLQAMVVCDDAARQTLIQRGFRQAGSVEQTHLADADAAWQHLLAREHPPHLLLIDVGQDAAVALLERIRQRRRLRSLPAVVLGEQQSEQAVARCLDAGATAYLHRPDAPDDLAEMTIRIAEFWRQHHGVG